MTFSIVARSGDVAGAPAGTSLGVAVASRFLAAGSAVAAAEAEVGAVATQSYANLAYRPQGLALLRTGVGAADTVAGLVAADSGRVDRQLGVVGVHDDGATFTGPNCDAWAGGVAGDGYAIQGNTLAGPEVVAAMESAWLASSGSLARRLLGALAAGDRAGGDRRGRQSASLLVVQRGGGYGGTSDIAVDLRVDDHPAPVEELARLLGLHEFYFTRPDPATLLELTGELAREVREKLMALGFSDLDSWAGWENLEERMVPPDKIDPVVLNHLRHSTHLHPPR
jgi:uncharacterized Ntn-hydrolase superfamily protein